MYILAIGYAHVIPGSMPLLLSIKHNCIAPIAS